MKFLGKRSAEPVSFQMAPMIDMVFLLLCFSIVSQIYARWETEIDIRLPTAQTGKTPQRLPGEIVLNIDGNGQIIFNGQELDEKALEALLRRVVSLFPNQPVLIRADGKTHYDNVVRVLDVCRMVDLWNVSFATGIREKRPGGGTE